MTKTSLYGMLLTTIRCMVSQEMVVLLESI